MVQNVIFSIVIFLFSGTFALVFGQTPSVSVKPSVIVGDVVTIDQTRIVVNAKSGAVDVALTGKTEFKRVSAENPTLSAATPSAATDIVVGDRLMVTGILAADGKSIPARAVYLMAKTDIAQKQAKESERWKTRGITGRVTTVNMQSGQITIDVLGMMGATTSTVVTLKPAAKFKRYAPDSVKFDEAESSSISDIGKGDIVRAVGDKGADGTTFAAEEVLSGAFQTIAGAVKSIDVAKNEVVITNLQTKKDVTISLGTSSVMKKFPTEMAERLAGAQAGGGMARPAGQGGARPVGQAGQGAQGGAAPVAGTTPGGGRPGGFGGARPGVGNIDEMLERFPNITAADLKAGDMIAVSSTRTANVDRITAIKLLAGVEPFLRMAQATSGRPGGLGAAQTGFQIPGLDGISIP